jgi:hypothetical protein
MRSRGVLDRPVKPGDDSFDCGGRLTKRQFLPRSAATKQSSFLFSLSLHKSWIASRSLSSGAHSRDPFARNDGLNKKRRPIRAPFS